LLEQIHLQELLKAKKVKTIKELDVNELYKLHQLIEFRILFKLFLLHIQCKHFLIRNLYELLLLHIQCKHFLLHIRCKHFHIRNLYKLLLIRILYELLLNISYRLLSNFLNLNIYLLR
jgi:hypothetical protein